jgi:acyl carrier protein
MVSVTDNKLKDIIIKNLRHKINPESITEDINIVENFRIDSLQLTKILVDIESEFGIKFDDPSEIINILSSLKKLKEVIQVKLSE